MAKATTKSKVDSKADISVEEKLRALYELQQIDAKIDRIRTLRGELPLEVQDLTDEIQGLETRVSNLTEELKSLEEEIVNKKNTTKEAEALIKKYQGQQSKVRNNREYDSITKEIEFQNLEIQLAEKRIKEYKAAITSKKEIIEEATKKLEERKSDLQHKQAELDEIVKETKQEEDALLKRSKQAESIIEDRLLSAYKRIRKNAKNGIAVVAVERDSCEGYKIPPQRLLDIRTHKKIIVCEYTGKILVDAKILTGEEVQKED